MMTTMDRRTYLVVGWLLIALAVLTFAHVGSLTGGYGGLPIVNNLGHCLTGDNECVIIPPMDWNFPIQEWEDGSWAFTPFRSIHGCYESMLCSGPVIEFDLPVTDIDLGA